MGKLVIERGTFEAKRFLSEDSSVIEAVKLCGLNDCSLVLSNADLDEDNEVFASWAITLNGQSLKTGIWDYPSVMLRRIESFFGKECYSNEHE